MANAIASTLPAASAAQEKNESRYTTLCKTRAAHPRQRLIRASELNVNRVINRRNVLKFKISSVPSLSFSSTVTRTCELRLLERGVERSTRTNCLSKLLEGGAEVQKELARDETDAFKSTHGPKSTANASDTDSEIKPSLVQTSDRLYSQNEAQLRAEIQAGIVKSASAGESREDGQLDVCTSGRRELLLGTAVSGLTAFWSFRARRSLAATNASATETKEEVTPTPAPSHVVEPEEKVRAYRIYDASVLGEPEVVGKDKGRVWQKLLAARVVYLGEAESVPDPDDKVLELQIVQTLREKCFEQQRPVSVAIQAFPCTLQKQLNLYMSKRLSDDELRGLVPHWPDERWQEYQPLLHFCQNNGVRLMAGGTPPEVLRTVQVRGVQGLSDIDKRKYVPPMGGGFGVNSAVTSQQLYLADVLPNASAPFGPGPYRFAQARKVEDHTMSQVVVQAMADGGSVGLLIVILGATHVLFGSRGSGLPARISKNLQKRTQAVVLLNPERQRIRKEGELPEADFLWYSAAKLCSRNCFDRAEIARVMDAAGRRPEALPKDLQTGIDLGLISPKVLKDFFDLEKQPFIAELTQRYQGFRERWLADPSFFQRLGFEEAISITTTLIAQYERRKGRFIQELDYVITDTVRGAVVDFFTVWLPAPTLSFRPSDVQSHASGALEGLTGFLGSLPDNAFQRATGQNWDLRARVLAVLIGGLKLFSVGFVASVGTVTVTNMVQVVRQYLNSQNAVKKQNKKSPILKTALVYSGFLGTSANLRYQAIAGIIEHWIADYYLASQPVAGYFLSFLARTANSFWGTQQWVDLARLTALQGSSDELPAVAEELEFKAQAASETIEVHSPTSEFPADQIHSKPTSWEASMIEHITAKAVQDEHFDEEGTDNTGRHGN